MQGRARPYVQGRCRVDVSLTGLPIWLSTSQGLPLYEVWLLRDQSDAAIGGQRACCDRFKHETSLREISKNGRNYLFFVFVFFVKREWCWF